MKRTENANSSSTNSNFWVRYGWLMMVIATVVGLVLRNTQRGFETYDMLYDFVPWSEHLRTHGGFGGIATLHTDYPVMYLYILAILTYLPGSTMAKIKLVTVLVEIIAGFFIYLYVRRLYPNAEKRYMSVIAYLCFFFLPSVILNGAVWGQVDIIYTCFLLICLYFLASQKYNLAFLAYGLAFAFKLQAIFFLPFLGMHFLKTRKYSFAQFLWIPLVLLVTSMPAIFLGRPAKEVFSVYFGQIGEYSRTVFNFGNIYTFLPDDYARFALPGVILMLLLLFVGLFLILRDRKLTLTPFNLPDFALLSILVCASFLPGMHERYMFAAIVIAVLYLFAHPLQFYIPLTLWVIEPNAYLIVLWGMRPPIDYRLSAVLLILVIILIIINVFKSRQIGTAEIQQS
jgi:Gpi18-like mannosyltransferase